MASPKIELLHHSSYSSAAADDPISLFSEYCFYGESNIHHSGTLPSSSPTLLIDLYLPPAECPFKRLSCHSVTEKRDPSRTVLEIF